MKIQLVYADMKILKNYIYGLRGALTQQDAVKFPQYMLAIRAFENIRGAHDVPVDQINGLLQAIYDFQNSAYNVIPNSTNQSTRNTMLSTAEHLMEIAKSIHLQKLTSMDPSELLILQPVGDED